ncbi:hypothetical protein P261_00003 [Lachnospiraceae bacterium TWA4]|nr:hypothetical protein P261_00003 [Lachnospiraceae bacterium TWA4]
MVFRIAKEEVKRWMRNTRMIILAVILVFIHIQVIRPLRECVNLMNQKVTILEAFIAVGNSGSLVLFVPALFLVLLADFPEKSGIDLFYQVRCSKRTWVLGQILFAIQVSIFLTLFLMIGSSILMASNGQWQMNYSEAITHYLSKYPQRDSDYISKLVPQNLFHQITFEVALIHTTVLMTLHFLILALILLFAALCNRKILGVLTDGFLIILGTITTSANLSIKWLFPIPHTISWIHYSEYFSEPIFPMVNSYSYMILMCISLFIGCMIVTENYQPGKDFT